MSDEPLDTFLNKSVRPEYGTWETVKIGFADDAWRPVMDSIYAQATHPWDYEQVEIKSSGLDAPRVVKWAEMHPAINVANMMWRPFTARPSSSVPALPGNKPGRE